MGLDIHVAVEKRPRFGLSLSGDQAQVVERQRGGVSLIMADGQGHGAGARRTALLVANRAASLISEGARDGPTARAAHDLLHAQKDGRVSCTLTIISADLHTHTLLISQNGPDVVLVRVGGRAETLFCPYGPIGIGLQTKPYIHEFPMLEDTVIAALSDGILSPDRWSGTSDVIQTIERMVAAADAAAVAELARDILGCAHSAAGGRPRDDMTVGVFGIASGTDDPSRVFHLRFPA